MPYTIAAFMFIPASMFFASTVIDPTTMLMAAVGTLGSVVAVLWGNVTATHKETKSKLTDCEQDRERLWHAMADVKGTNPETLRRQYSEADTKK